MPPVPSACTKKRVRAFLDYQRDDDFIISVMMMPFICSCRNQKKK
jgi:hypothetical protein